jgi:hypothetical protein
VGSAALALLSIRFAARSLHQLGHLADDTSRAAPAPIPVILAELLKQRSKSSERCFVEVKPVASMTHIEQAFST